MQRPISLQNAVESVPSIMPNEWVSRGVVLNLSLTSQNSPTVGWVRKRAKQEARERGDSRPSKRVRHVVFVFLWSENPIPVSCMEAFMMLVHKLFE